MAFSEADPKPLVACWASARVWAIRKLPVSSFGSVPRKALLVIPDPEETIDRRKFLAKSALLAGENADTFQALLEYPKGFLVSYSTSFGNDSQASPAIWGKKQP